MVLIKENIEKGRSVYKDNNLIRKNYFNKDIVWLLDHMEIMDNIMPGYIVGGGTILQGVYINMINLPGIRADKFIHTPEFIKKIYNFCLELNTKTYPYYHGDWVLSNMFIDEDVIYMCDWDNVGKHPSDQAMTKLYSDLYSAFGDQFKEIYDSATI